MDKEQYVTHETAQLLKEKGFDWAVLTCYQNSEFIYVPLVNWNKFSASTLCSAPTQQMAVRWVWEERGLNINAIYGDYPSQKKSFWMPQIDSLDGCYGVDDEDFFREYDSREECIEAALRYTLNKLI